MWRGERGQTAIEYAGLLTLVALIVVAVAQVHLPQRLGGLISTAVCELNGDKDCGGGSTRTLTRKKGDRDGDGLSDKRERRLGTSLTSADSDADGIADGDEVRRKLDPRSRDTDRDGIQDAREAQLAKTKGVDPTKADSDGDGLLDGAELAAGTPPNFGDADKDTRGGNPDADGRGDGLSDYDEIYRYGTDPRRSDTDEDGQTDGEEVKAGTNPLVDERSLGTKVAIGVTGFILDDPSNLSPKGIVKGLGKGLGKLGKKVAGKLGVGAGKKVDDAITETADNIAAARKRREDARKATPAPRTEGPLTKEQDAAVKATLRDPNKLNHIFGKQEHNLDPLVNELGGREALIREAVLAVPRGTAGKFEVTTNIGGHPLTVRGVIVDGVPRIGTLFSPP
jgi:Flp pilus assembly pilin Flp